ncbi:putative bifunctional inhibitor/plant lipid transfer protein/seed storage helical [Lupinus albus]|uniref:Putative bifunctional inhibitor/plant lipid transfer protein/seed storage helical n=1 Tax=Lupinus albus TaxID=3870 RepID=A0A6A4QY03_LUPAL|nr:putative bifunctional inhibitor/plant lipid transfer protein/seed storage helical [Lupinus albus]
MDPKVACTFIMLTFLFFNCVAINNLPCPPKSTASSPSIPKSQAKCPKDRLKFGVCGSWLGLVTEVIGTKPSEKCCTLVKGLADLEAALCLCTAIKSNVLGIVNLKVHVAVSLIVNACGKKVPNGFFCA